MVCVQCPIRAILCSSLISCLPNLLISYCLSDFETVPVAPVISGINFARTIYTRWIYFMRYSYFKIFSAFFLIKFLSRGTATSINMLVPFLLSWIMMSGLLLEMILSDRTSLFHNMVILLSWLVSANFGTCSYQCSLSNFTSISLRMLLYHVSISILLFQYWVCWYNVFYCLIELFREPAFVICWL